MSHESLERILFEEWCESTGMEKPKLLEDEEMPGEFAYESIHHRVSWRAWIARADYSVNVLPTRSELAAQFMSTLIQTAIRDGEHFVTVQQVAQDALAFADGLLEELRK